MSLPSKMSGSSRSRTHLIILAEERTPILLDIELVFSDQICGVEELTLLSSYSDLTRAQFSTHQSVRRTRSEHSIPLVSKLSSIRELPFCDNELVSIGEWQERVNRKAYLASMMKSARQILGERPVCE